MEAVSFPKPAFKAMNALFVPVELVWGQQTDAIQPFGVRSFPNFAVLDAGGKAVVPPGATLQRLLILKPIVEAVTELMNTQVRLALESHRVPAQADVVLAQVALLQASGQGEVAGQWLAKAVADPRVRPEQLAVLKAYRGLEMRREGKLAEGLALLQEVAPTLKLREAAPAEAATVKGPAPFVVAGAKVDFGVVASDADAHLAADALAWLSGLAGDIPAPAGLDAATLARGAAALATVLNRPQEAAPWLAAYSARAGDQAYRDQPGAIYADGLVKLAQGKLGRAARRLLNLVQFMPEAGFSPQAGVLAYETAKTAGDADLAKRAAQLLQDTYGTRLPQALKARLM